MKRIVVISAVLAVIGLICLFAVYGCSRKEAEPAPNNFPQHLNDRVVLKEVKAKEKIRFVHYLPDGVTKKAADVEYVDGQSAHIEYRPDGTMSEASIFHPLKKDETERRLFRHIEFDKDGIGYLSERLMTDSGKLQRFGKRIGKEEYEVYLFAPEKERVIPMDNGFTIIFRYQTRQQLFKKVEVEQPPPYYWFGPSPFPPVDPSAPPKKKWKLVVEKIFRDSTAVIEKEIEHLDNGGESVKLFTEGGVLASHRVSDKWNSEINTTHFYEDGKTVKLKTVQRSWNVSATAYRKDGTVELEYVFGYNDDMTVTGYDAQGKTKFKQEWSYDHSETDNAGNSKRIYKLKTVTEIDPSGNAKRTIDFHDDGKTPKTVTTPGPGNTGTTIWSGPRVVKGYRPDGTLEKVETYGQGSSPDKTENHKQEEGLRETIDPELVAPHSFAENPPSRAQSTYNPYDPWGYGYDMFGNGIFGPFGPYDPSRTGRPDPSRP